MRPPVCDICGKDFTPGKGAGTVSFAHDESEPWWKGRFTEEEVAEHGEPVGHPPYVGWFCRTHYEAAHALRELEIGAAQARLREAEEEGTLGELASRPIHTRPWFKGVALVMGVLLMLALLGLIFSPRYWRF